jgi:large subunit ribosomal protein L6
MSRVGLKAIGLPDKTTVDVGDGVLTIKGPKGTLTTPVQDGITAKVADGALSFERASNDRHQRAFHGLARALAANALEGVSKGFERRLTIIGVGYRAATKGKNVELILGYSHPVIYPMPEGIEITVEENTKLLVKGIDKQAVGQVAAELRALRPPDAYKGKGVRYADEIIRLKAGKAGAR